MELCMGNRAYRMCVRCWKCCTNSCSRCTTMVQYTQQQVLVAQNFCIKNSRKSELRRWTDNWFCGSACVCVCKLSVQSTVCTSLNGDSDSLWTRWWPYTKCAVFRSIIMWMCVWVCERCVKTLAVTLVCENWTRYNLLAKLYKHWLLFCLWIELYCSANSAFFDNIASLPHIEIFHWNELSHANSLEGRIGQSEFWWKRSF